MCCHVGTTTRPQGHWDASCVPVGLLRTKLLVRSLNQNARLKVALTLIIISVQFVGVTACFVIAVRSVRYTL